jgi:hypothetical protein
VTLISQTVETLLNCFLDEFRKLQGLHRAFSSCLRGELHLMPGCNREPSSDTKGLF